MDKQVVLIPKINSPGLFLVKTVGVLLLISCMALPAVKHGQVLSGFGCIVVSTLVAFMWTGPSNSGNALIWICRFALRANTGVLTSLVLAI